MTKTNTELEPQHDALHRCYDCSAESPRTETEFTLISAKHGWRLSTEVDTRTKRRNLVWRCPECWRKHKEAKR